MNKSELIETIAAEADLDLTAAQSALDAMVGAISTALAEGDKISIPKFGAFEVRQRSARAGHNPRTGETIEIAAGAVPVFRPCAALKKVVNSSAVTLPPSS